MTTNTPSPSYSEQMQKIFARYEAEVSAEPADLREVGKWAIAQGLWKPRPVDLEANFAREMADALREQMRTDKAGRRYRAKIPAKAKTADGAPLFKWGDADTARHACDGCGPVQDAIELA